MASTFANWFRGMPISNTAAGSSSHFGRGYRGAQNAPVVRVGDAATAAASGGLESGGSTAATVGFVVLAGGGLSIGGVLDATVARGPTASGGARLGGSATATATTPEAAANSFRYWRRGAPVSNSSYSASGHFGRARRGAVGLAAAFVQTTGQSYTATACGGASLGGAVQPSRASVAAMTAALRLGGSAGFGLLSMTASATGGARLGGAATAAASFATSADGGLDVSGRAVVEALIAAPAAAGWTFGGRSGATLSASASPSGGATFGGSRLVVELGYHVYMNDGQGGPIDYATPVDTVYDASWTSPALTAPSSHRFGVRAFFASTGLEEQNIDASVRLDLDADGRDVTWTPLPPIGPRAIPLAGGRLRIEWSATATEPRRQPLGFRVYVQAVALTDYTTPAAVVPFAADGAGTFAVEIGGLADGARFAVGVRSFNASGEERNVSCVFVHADSSPPSPIAALQATSIARIN